MKPKTKMQREIVALSRRLPKITAAQLRWAKESCFDHKAQRTAKGYTTCLECGTMWRGEGRLTEELTDCVCPHCGKRLTLLQPRKRTYSELEYACVATTFGGYQVLRFYYILMNCKVGKSADYFVCEVVQRWIAPNGRYATMAMLRPQFCWNDRWQWSSRLEIRPDKPLYDILPTAVYPRVKVLPEIARNGFNGKFYGLTPFEMFHSILADNRAETLLKTGQTELLLYFIRRQKSSADYWNSIRIATRNGYKVEDANLWCDYIDLLRYFGKDTNSPKYVCPAELNREHDRLVKSKQERLERERQAEARRRAIENEALYRNAKSRFLGIAFSDGEIDVHVLQSVAEFLDEGTAMHHCVFTNEYYLQPDALILSAQIGGRRIETIEVSLKTLKVIQSRGVCNQLSSYHDRIVALVKKNMKTIRRQVAA